MSFQTLSERLTALQESNAQLKNLIERLSTIKFQPGSIPLDNEEGNVMTELASEIQQTLKDQDEDLELLQEDVNDLDPGRQGSELEQQKDRIDQAVKRAIKELKGCQTAFRRAQLSARRNLQMAQRAERELLLQSYLEPRSSTASPLPGQQRRRKEQNKELSKEDKEVNASTDVTLALRRTHDMMTAELSRSQFAHDTLKESTAALAQLSETYSSLDTMLSRSRNLLGTLLTSQKSDTWYLETAFYILLATIAWLVWRRLLYGPTWWILWFLPRLFFRGCFGVLTLFGVMGGQKPDIGMSPAVEQETVIHSSGTRGPKITTTGQIAPSINVGGGGKGGPGPSPRSSHEVSGENMSEKIGKIIDESGEVSIDGEVEEGTSDRTVEGGLVEDQPNPKKRMWEEEKESVKAAERAKVEL
ncbi:Sec20-domain-containing protein [Stipitochalara longipes BDJ]|nr:Sec20-domain-containing protein [Stipitochalara longipes BDJ]